MTTNPRSAVHRLFVSRVISVTGGAAAFVALNVSIFQKTHSTAWLAASLLVTYGVEGMVAPIAGALGDRFDRRVVMIVSDLAGAAVFLVMALVHSPGLLLPLAFLSALAEAPFFTASAAAMPNLVSEEDLAWANGMVAVGRNSGIVLGPLIGGLAVASVGAGAVFAVNAASFVLSALLVVSVHGTFSGVRDDDSAHRGFKAGFRYLWGDRILRTVTFAWLAMVFGMGMTMVADLPLVGLFHVGSFGYGVLIAFWGGGSIVGSLLAGRLKGETEPRALVAGLAVIAVTSVATGVSPWFVMACGTILLMGIGDGVSLVANQGIMQRRTPDAVRARVSGAMEAFIHSGLAVSYLVGGPAVAALGPRAVYVMGGMAALIGVAVAVPALGRTATGAMPHANVGITPSPAEPGDLLIP
jgi:MFS family permease